jgi:hypothetical protein
MQLKHETTLTIAILTTATLQYRTVAGGQALLEYFLIIGVRTGAVSRFSPANKRSDI